MPTGSFVLSLPGPDREHRAQRIDMHLAARRLAGRAKPVAHLPVLLAQRQPAHAALWRAAEFRRLVDVAPQPVRVDVQIGQPAESCRPSEVSELHSLTSKRRAASPHSSAEKRIAEHRSAWEYRPEQTGLPQAHIIYMSRGRSQFIEGPGATSMTYRAPLNDILLALNHGAGFAKAAGAKQLGDYDAEMTAAVLEEAGKFAEDVLAPLNRDGDKVGAKYADGKVTTAPGWPDAYTRWAGAGWNAVSGAGAMGRPRPAVRHQCRLHGNVELGQHGVRPLPAADRERDRGAGRARHRGSEEALSRKTDLRRMDRHDAAHRVAGRLRRRRAAHAAPRSRPTAPTSCSARRSSSPMANTT